MIGRLPYFSLEYSEWRVYHELLELYFEVNEITAEKRKALLIISIDDLIYKELRTLCHPQLPKNKSYEQLLELLSQQYVVRTSTHRERVAFYTARQEKDETVTEWFARLKKLSVNCKFGERLDNVMLDRFVSGLKSDAILDWFCDEESSLSLEKTVEIATEKEAVIGPVLNDAEAEHLAIMECGTSEPCHGETKKRNRRKKAKNQEAE